MVQCQYCGQTFGNAGAKASHENACDEKPENRPGQGSVEKGERSRRGGQPEAKPPQPRQQQNQETRPAVSEDEQAMAQQMGQAGGELFSALDSDDPQKRADATELMTGAVAEGIKTVGMKKAQEMRDQHQRAREHGGQTAEPVEDEVVICGVCEGHIQRVPEGGQFSCPHCGSLVSL